MSALTIDKMVRQETWKYHQLPLATGAKAFKGGTACIDTSTGTLKQGAASTTLIIVGVFADDYDNTAGGATVLVNVDLLKERVMLWRNNDAGTPVTAANVGSVCYVLDDQTVTGLATGHSTAGRVWAVDAVQGVLVEIN